MGSAELDRKTIDAAPAVETPRPELRPRPPHRHPLAVPFTDLESL